MCVSESVSSRVIIKCFLANCTTFVVRFIIKDDFDDSYYIITIKNIISACSKMSGNQDVLVH